VSNSGSGRRAGTCRARADPGTLSGCGGGDSGLWAWGQNFNDKLGVGDTNDRLVPTQIGTATDWVTLPSSFMLLSSFAVNASGNGFAWGANRYGQLGVGDVAARVRPRSVPAGSRSAATGSRSRCATADQ
jgi:Regulator of chromosome condensation (RCC1) repeat